VSEIASLSLVSVVVASYNHAEYLEQRIKSLINQTYQNIEILVIDDCSTDNSINVLQKYKSHPRVKLIINKENKGWVKVSNQGIDIASGEFVILANCDDDCDATMLQRLVDSLQKYPSAGIAFCRSTLIDEHGKNIGEDFSFREIAFQKRCCNDTLLTGKEMSGYLLHSCVIPNLSGALFRKQNLIDLGYLPLNYKVCGDWELYFRISEKYDFAFISEPLNKFRQHPYSICKSTKDRIIVEEYLSLLLKEAKRLNLAFFEMSKARVGAMRIWAAHLISPSCSGFRDLPFHLKCVCKHDIAALCFFPLGVCLRLIGLTIRSYKIAQSKLKEFMYLKLQKVAHEK
jgi:glycosyltransferase involved in cell wall biosynthesis